MDTLGTISPKISDITESARRQEALERLRYLGETGGTGILFGESGTGKSHLLEQLAQQLRRQGVTTISINLSGMGGPELARQVAIRFGLGIPFHAQEFEIWSRLQEFGESARFAGHRIAFVLDHLERAKESIQSPLARLLDLFVDRCAWLIASRPNGCERWHQFLEDRNWLRVELKQLQPRESNQFLGRHFTSHAPHAQLTEDGATEAHKLAEGRIRRLRHLAELATLAVEAEGLTEINAELVRCLAQELTTTVHE